MKISDFPQDIEPRVGDIIEIEQGDVCFEVRIIGITADGYLCEQDNVEGAVLLEGLDLVEDDASDIEDFLRSGGKIQKLPYKNARKEKSAHYRLASRHIGGSGHEQTKGKLAGLRGRAAAVNVSGTGKAVVGEDCWDGYKQEGMKKKGDRMVPNCVPEGQENIEEAGPFSYGYKKPRKGSVAYWAEKKRKEQEKGKPPIEPKDQMVGVAKVTKSVAEGTEQSLQKKIQAKRDALGLAREQRRARGQHQQGQREIKLQAEIDKLSSQLTQIKKQDVAEGWGFDQWGHDTWTDAQKEVARKKKYEMMLSNGKVKRFTAKDDADAKRIAKGHGAKSVIKMKGDLPGNKIAEQGVAEGYTGRETKDGTWRVFKDGQAVAVAGPFKSRDEAHAWIKKQKTGVSEAKSLKKRVRVVQGEHAGKTGWIREIKHGIHSTAPKRYYVDLDGGGQANNLPASALRLLKNQSDSQTGMAEATGDSKFDAMMGNIKKSAPVPVSGYVAVEYASESPSDRIKGVTLKGKPMPSSVDVDDLDGEIEFGPDEIERHLIKIGRDNGWSIIDPGHGRGYSELFFDTNANYTSDTQSILAKNIVNTVNQINKFFSGLNSSLRSTGLPGYKVAVWQEISSPNGQKIGDINQIKQIALTKVVHSPNDPGELIGQAILRELPAVEQDEYDDFTPEDFAYARKIAKIYITKGERAGLKAQISNRRMDHVSDLIDELLSLSGAQKYRTLKLDDLDEQSMAEVRGNIDADQAGFYVVDDDGNAVSGPFASQQEAYERAAEMGRMYDVKYKGDVIPLDSLIRKIIKTLPPDVTSDNLQDPMDLEQQLKILRSPLLQVFSKLSPYEQAEVTDEVANHFYDRRPGGFAERKQKGVAEGGHDDPNSFSGRPDSTDQIPQDSTRHQDRQLAMVNKIKQQTIGDILKLRPEFERSDLELATTPELIQMLRDIQSGKMTEAEYQGRKVPLGKPMAGDVKKSKVYVRKPNGKVVKVNFGDKTMKIKKSNPKRRKSFRARHNCANPGPRWKARYWSCRAW